MHQGSPVLPVFRSASAVIFLLPKATHTLSIQSNLGLPRTRTPLTSDINTHLVIRYSAILCRCVKPIQCSISILALLHTSSFPNLSIRDPSTNFSHTSPQEHSLSLNMLIPRASVSEELQLLLHVDTSHLSPILPTLYTPHSFCVPYPFHIIIIVRV